MIPTHIIQARHFLDPEGRIVESAALLADEVVRQLASHNTVTVDLRELRGLSSSYFNVLLQRVSQVTTLAEFPTRVQLLFDSTAQQQVFNRSLDRANRTVA
jgi:hypothetical protein